MKIATTIDEVRNYVATWRKNGHTVGFVPTMGYLHEGHGSLVEYSVAQNDKTVVSIFVNPTQFAPNEDFSNYPRDFQADVSLCERLGADLIFAPQDSEMYANFAATFIDMKGTTDNLCGKSRPTHFRGVCTVVCKLFNIVAPDKAYFGRKDAQQLAVIRRMVADLNINVEVVGCPIVREADGLAKSSRNTYLIKAEREAATVISNAVFAAENLIKSGECCPNAVCSVMRKIIEAEPLARIDYIEIVNAETMQKIDAIKGNVLVAVAVFIGKTRLIDNCMVEKN